MVYSASDVPVIAWTLAAKSPTVNPCRRRHQRQGGAQCVPHPLFVQVDTADVGGTEPGAGGQLVEHAVGEESGVHTVQRGGESFGDAGQPGDDLGELLDHPPAPQFGGVVRDRLEPQHAFALSVLGTPVKVGSVGCLRCLASFRHTCLGAVDRSRGRGGAPAAQRGRTTSRPARIRRKLGRPGTRQRRCGSSHLLPPGRENVLRETSLRVPAPSLTRKSDGEWAAEGTRRSRVMWYCCGFGIMRRHR